MSTNPTPRVRTWSEAQALTRAAPTLVTEGISLDGVESFRVILSADEGETLSGAGELECYAYSYLLERWVRVPELDLGTITATFRDMSWGELESLCGFGRVLYAATGVTVSGGTCTVQIEARYEVSKR